MSADDRDVRLEELLRTSLYDEAETIVPAGDGLSRIQSRVTTRRARAAWWHPMAALGGVAVVAVAGFAAYALTRAPAHPSSVKTSDNGNLPTPTPDASVSTPAAPVVSKPTFPASAFYPFTSAAAEQQWVAQDGPSKQPWVIDPKLLAKMFVSSFVQQSGVDQVFASMIHSRTATVTLGRTLHDGNRAIPVKVTTVSLAKFDQAWLVVGASDGGGQLKLTNPKPGQTLTSPAFVAGPGYGVDESVQVDIRTVSGIARTGNRPTVAFGNGVPQWSTTVPFSAADPRGAVVVVELSAADGGPGRITAVGVNFATVQAASYPTYFYGVKNGRVTKFSARNGAPISYLTPTVAGVNASDPQLVGDHVYYVYGNGICGNVLRSVPVAGGASTQVAQADPGFTISGFSVLGSNTGMNTFFETACDSAVSPQGRLVFDTGQRRTIDFPAFPPMVVGDPAWAADGQHVVVVVRTGTQADVRQYDAFKATSVDSGSPACSIDAGGGLPNATQVDSSGTVWAAVQTGSGMQVVRCAGGQISTAFTVTGTDTPADLAIADNGQAALLTDTSGAVWRWTAGGSVEQVQVSVPQTQVTW